MTFRFRCASCGETHEGMPTFGSEAPLAYYAVPEEKRDQLCQLGTDACVIENDLFFVRGCVEIPVHGEAEPFIWGLWVLLSSQNFAEWLGAQSLAQRSHFGPYFGWLDSALTVYPVQMNLKTRVHLRDNGIRPYLELEPTSHPMAIEQREGISVDRVAEIYRAVVHGSVA